MVVSCIIVSLSLFFCSFRLCSILGLDCIVGLVGIVGFVVVASIAKNKRIIKLVKIRFKIDR